MAFTLRLCEHYKAVQFTETMLKCMIGNSMLNGGSRGVPRLPCNPFWLQFVISGFAIGVIVISYHV